MNFKYLIIVLFIGLISCEKDEDIINDNIPSEVTFNYNGENVTYQVIKKDYYKDSNGDLLETPISKLWLDRNLGAERQAIEKNDLLASGDLFQWGRSADGHQSRESDTTHTLSNSITPNHDKFIVLPLSQDMYLNWLIEPNNSLWSGDQNTNCPCPEGWRVPTINELMMEMHSWDSYNMDGAYSSELKWVSGGNRDNHGTERYTEFLGFVWSSTVMNDAEAKLLSIIGSDTSKVSTVYKIYGGSVRCIKDY
jgi:hypothetical protein